MENQTLSYETADASGDKGFGPLWIIAAACLPLLFAIAILGTDMNGDFLSFSDEGSIVFRCGLFITWFVVLVMAQIRRKLLSVRLTVIAIAYLGAAIHFYWVFGIKHGRL